MEIGIVNHATSVSNEDVALWARAYAYQLRYDLCPAWGIHMPAVVYLPDESMIPPGAQRLLFFDDADQQGVLGFHDETPDGQQYSKVYAGTSLNAGVAPSSVGSHEIVEMTVDAPCTFWAFDGQGKLVALEVGDPVEADSYPVRIRDPKRGPTEVVLSNFVTPAWFDPQAPAGGRLDWMHTAPAPFTMAPGGYVIEATLSNETQAFAAGQEQPADATETATVWKVDLRFADGYPEWRKATKAAPASRTRLRTLQRVGV